MRIARLSLRWRVAVAFGLVSLLLTGLLGVVTWVLATDYMLRQRETGAIAQAQANVRLVEDSLRLESRGLPDLLQGLATDTGSSVLLEQPTGWLTSGRQVGPGFLPPALVDMARRGVAAHQRLVVQGVPVLAVAWPVAGGGVFVQLFPLIVLDQVYRFLSGLLVVGVVLSGLLGAGIGLWASRRALRPLSELTRAASRVAAGDLQTRLPAQDDPDLMPLARTFNRTADALERRVRQDARFAGDVSHELRSPLTTMANAGEVLQRRRGELTGTAQRALDLLLAEIGRFRRMVVDLMEITRDSLLDEHAREVLDVGELVGNVAVHGGCRPLVELDGAGPWVAGDRRRLDRIVANLLDNAERHGGGAIRVGVLRREKVARIEVDDAGAGVPERLRERIFERFARGELEGNRGAAGGSGLGLALVAQHVALHGGRVWVEDRPGGGARFVVEIPAVPG